MGEIGRTGPVASPGSPGSLTAKRTSVWRSRYDIGAAGRTVTVWDGAVWRGDSSFELDRRRYEVRGNVWRTRFDLVVGDGARVASADRTQRRRWTVEADGVTYHFERPSVWRQEQELRAPGGGRVGGVRRTSFWRGDAVADLPGLPLPVQIFVVGIVLTRWDWQTTVAAAS